MNPTPKTTQTDLEHLRKGWLARLRAFLTVAGAGSEGEGEGEGAADDSGLDGVSEDADTVFGDDDDDDGEGQDDVEGEGEGEGDEDEGDDGDSLFDDPDDEDADDDAADDEGTTSDDEDGDEDEELDEEAQQRQAEEIERLDELWEARIERAKREEGEDPLKLDVKLGDVQATPELLSKFKEILGQDGDDQEIQVKAIFEVAMEAVVQSLNRYHSQGVLPHLQKQHTAAQRERLQSSWDEFKETAEGKTALAEKPLLEKMQEIWKKKVGEVGVALAMKIPYKDYFRLAGGRVKKGATKPPAKAAKKKASSRKAESQKRRALGGQRAPRARRGAAGVARQPKPKGVEQESAEYMAATSEPFFNVT